jgi:sugar/nucleoside kinase (ribokinase family)
MASQPGPIVVAGHICLDIIPAFDPAMFASGAFALEDLLVPGKLTTVGPAVTATGGAVSNTGLALHRLGAPTKLMGKIGDDLFGHAILDFIRSTGPGLADGMIVDPDAVSSYTLVINPPGVDRIFLHCPGANDTFGADDVNMEQVAGASLFHFGYPPIMRRIYGDGGVELAALMGRARATGAVTSLDASYPDPKSDAGQVDWRALLARVLPYADFFLPSLEETLFMLDRSRHDRLAADGDIIRQTDGDLLRTLSDDLLEMGVAVVGLKLGDQGLYLRTTSDPQRLANLTARLGLDSDGWRGRELLAPCFQAQVVGTTGAGDCTIAGFLAALLRGASPVEAMTSAVAVGAFNVESADATSGIPPWSEVEARIQSGWAQRSVELDLSGWTWAQERSVWIGPGDK